MSINFAFHLFCIDPKCFKKWLWVIGCMHHFSVQNTCTQAIDYYIEETCSSKSLLICSLIIMYCLPCLFISHYIFLIVYVSFIYFYSSLICLPFPTGKIKPEMIIIFNTRTYHNCRPLTILFTCCKYELSPLLLSRKTAQKRIIHTDNKLNYIELCLTENAGRAQ